MNNNLTAQTLQKVLSIALSSDQLTDDEILQVTTQLKKNSELQQLLTANNDIWKSEIEVVGAECSATVTNYLLYDSYGRLRRANPTITVDEAVARLRETEQDLLAGIPDCMIADGLSFVSDLWSDNDDLGYNNADGTYKPNCY